jgi:hypothetical protein
VGRLTPSAYNLFLILLGVFVLAGFLLVYRLRRDVDRESPVTDDDVLRDIERAYYAGQMDKAEFERVTAALRAKSEGTARPLPVKPAPPPEPAPSPLGEEAASDPPGSDSAP